MHLCFYVTVLTIHQSLHYASLLLCVRTNMSNEIRGGWALHVMQVGETLEHVYPESLVSFLVRGSPQNF